MGHARELLRCRFCRTTFRRSWTDKRGNVVDGMQALVDHVYRDHTEHADALDESLVDLDRKIRDAERD